MSGYNEKIWPHPTDPRVQFLPRTGHARELRQLGRWKLLKKPTGSRWNGPTDKAGHRHRVFEVSGVVAVVEAMTEIASARGRICMVAINASPPPVNLLQFFWKELEMVGARVYEAADFDRAIEIVANEEINLEPFITSVNSLSDIGSAFANMDGNPAGMKALLSCENLNIS